MAQSGSASALGAEGRGFKSRRPDHVKLRLRSQFFVFLRLEQKRCLVFRSSSGQTAAPRKSGGLGIETRGISTIVRSRHDPALQLAAILQRLGHVLGPGPVRDRRAPRNGAIVVNPRAANARVPARVPFAQHQELEEAQRRGRVGGRSVGHAPAPLMIASSNDELGAGRTPAPKLRWCGRWTLLVTCRHTVE